LGTNGHPFHLFSSDNNIIAANFSLKFVI
jgi:hypothetical protein